MKINQIGVGLISIVIIFGGILLSNALGMWNTESSKEPIKFNKGEFEGEYNPDDIRGSYSFLEVSETFNVPLDILAEAFELPKSIDLATFKNKDLELMYSEQLSANQEIGNGSVKIFVALYNGIPVYLEEDTYLLQSAVDILIQNGKLSDEQSIFIKSHVANIKVNESNKINETKNTSDIINSSNEESENIGHEENEDKVIKGKTLFKDLIEWGLAIDDIENVINGEMPNQLMNIKEYCQNEGIEFLSVKDQLQLLVEN